MAVTGTKSLEGIDIAIVVVYLLVVVATSFYAMCKSKRDTATGYFLAGRYITFLPVGASIFSSNIGSEHFIGLAGSGAATGLAVSAYEVFAVSGLQALGWLFTPVYMASGVTTLPEYMEKRFGGRRIRIFLSVLSLVLCILVKISVTLLSAALFIKAALHWNFVPAVMLVIGIAALCTISGGLAAVIYTDTVQTFLMCIGSFILMTLAFVEVGGIQELFRKYMEAIPNDRPENSTCGVPGEDSLRMLRGPGDADMPWPGFIFGMMSVQVWYWCADQVIVQRTLAAKNVSHAQGGTLLAGYLKFLPMFLLVLPGMISRVLYTDDIACATPEVCKEVCGIEAGCSNLAYPWLVMKLLPTGLRGIMVAVMMAAIISSLTSIFNSASSLFTMDIYPVLRKRPSNREQMIVGRAFVVVMTVASILWIPIVENIEGGQLFMYIQAVQAFLTPPIATVFLVAMLWPNANEQGAFWALMAGFISGCIKMSLAFAYPLPKCGEIDLRPGVVKNVNFLYFAIILLVQTGVIVIVVTLLTKPHDSWRLIRTTFWHRFQKTVRCDELPEAVAEYLIEEKTGCFERIPAIEHEDLSGNPVGQEIADSTDDDSMSHVTESHSLEANCWRQVRITLELAVDGTQKKRWAMIVEWLKLGTSWFCGLSLGADDGISWKDKRFNEQSQEEKARYTSKIQKECQEKVDEKVKSIRQTPKIKILLTVNLFIILTIMIFVVVFFSQ